jgi:hypothetical protein
VRLFRFAIISILGKADEWRDCAVVRKGARVRVMEAVEHGSALVLSIGADVALSELPQVGGERLVEVPEEPRRLAEKAIDATANLLSVATGSARAITSPNLPVAFYPESDKEREFLQGHVGVKDIDRGVAFGRMSVSVSADELRRLNDREAGVALLAEALSQDHVAGRYRELLRVFELAFAASESKLIVALAEFLAMRPRLAYTKTEVKRWLKRLRGRAVHADRSDPLVGADLGDVVDRMALAAYEVLFNRENWRVYDSVRRDVWTPSTGPLDADGNWFVRQHQTEAPLNAQLYDPYGVYPLHLGTAGLQLADEGFWPRSGPEPTTAGNCQITIMPASDLALAVGKDGDERD